MADNRTPSNTEAVNTQNQRRDYRADVTAKIIEQIEQGTAPWQKPWNPALAGQAFSMPFNATTGRAYRGGNAMHLLARAFDLGSDDPRWCTFKQAKAQNWSIKKGSKGTLIEYWKFEEDQEVIDPETQEKSIVRVKLPTPQVFYGTVFHASQIEGIPEYTGKPKPSDWNPVAEAQRILDSSGVPVLHDQIDRAFYRPSTDEIHMPAQSAFPSAADYYEVVMHELAHATGHPKRMNRDLSGAFGSESYAREELRAQMASLYLSMELGLPFNPERHAAYNGAWLKVLSDNKHEIFRAARDAEAIADHVLGMALERDLEQERQNAAQEAVAEQPAPQPTTAPEAEPELPQPVAQPATTGNEFPFGQLPSDSFDPRFAGSRVRVLPKMRGESAWEGTVHHTLKYGRLIEVVRDGAQIPVRISGDRIEIIQLVQAEPAEQPQAVLAKQFENLRANPPSGLPASVNAAMYAFAKVAGHIEEPSYSPAGRWRAVKGFNAAMERGTGLELFKLMEDSLLQQANDELQGLLTKATQHEHIENLQDRAMHMQRCSHEINRILDLNDQRTFDVERVGGDEALIASSRSFQAAMRMQRSQIEQQATELLRKHQENESRAFERSFSAAQASDFKKKPTPAAIQGWRTSQYKGVPAFTNGHLADIGGTEPHTANWDKYKAPGDASVPASSMERVIPTGFIVDSMIPMEIIARNTQVDAQKPNARPKHRYVIMSRGEGEPVAAFNQDYISYFVSKYPQAQFYAHKPNKHTSGSEMRDAAVVKDGDKVVGVVMPTRFDSGLTPADIREILARNELEAKLLAENAPAAEQQPAAQDIEQPQQPQPQTPAPVAQDGTAQDAQEERLTVEQAKELLRWQDNGVSGGVKSHALHFYESAEKLARRIGRMEYGELTKGDISDTKWYSHTTQTLHDTLQEARKAAIEHAIDRLIDDGYVAPQEPEAPYAPYVPVDQKALRKVPTSIHGWSETTLDGKRVYMTDNIIDLSGSEPHQKNWKDKINELRPEVPESSAQRVFTRLKERGEYLPLTPVAMTKSIAGNPVVALARKDNEAAIYLDADFVRYVQSKFPDCTLSAAKFVFDKSRSNLVQVQSAGELVAVIAPIHFERTTRTPAQIKDLIKSLENTTEHTITPDNDPRVPFEIEGRKVYPTFVRDDGKIVPFWGVQSEENIHQPGRVAGDSLHATKELAERAAFHEARQAAERAAQALQAQAQQQAASPASTTPKDNLNGFAKGKPPVAVGKIRKELGKQVSIDGRTDTIRGHIERWASRNDLSLGQYKENKLKPMSSREFFNASHAEQVAHEKRVKQAGTKTVYLVNNYDLGKIAHDYAAHLQNTRALERSKTNTDLFVAPATRSTTLFKDLNPTLSHEERLGIVTRLSEAIEATSTWKDYFQESYGTVAAFMAAEADLSTLPIPVRALLADPQTIELAQNKGLITYSLINEESGSIQINKVRPAPIANKNNEHKNEHPELEKTKYSEFSPS